MKDIKLFKFNRHKYKWLRNYAMRLNEIDFEESIKEYSIFFKEILRKSRNQTDEMCRKWEESIKNGLDVPHPLEITLGIRIKSLHDVI